MVLRKLYSIVPKIRGFGSGVKAPSSAAYKLCDLGESPTSLCFSVLMCKAEGKQVLNSLECCED